MGSTEKFCLRWNDFETNVSVAFRELREDKDFFDVTLACDDSQVEAHKVILSACSPFFRQVLRRNPHQHPLLYLRGVKFKELLAVLNFMYQGEVNVAQEELNAFLAVAEDLRVKGLTQNNSSPGDNRQTDLPSSGKSAGRSREPPDRGDTPATKRPRITPSSATNTSSNRAASNNFAKDHNSHDDDDDIQEVVPVKVEPREVSHLASSTAVTPVVTSEYAGGGSRGGSGEEVSEGGGQLVLEEEDYAEDSYDYGEYGDGGGGGGGGGLYGEESGLMDPNTGLPIPSGTDGNKDLNSLISTMLTRNPNNSWSCSQCQYTATRKAHVQAHVEAKHVSTGGFYCQECGKFCNTRNALMIHRTRFHQQRVS